jgi:citrate lyase beta subunit
VSSGVSFGTCECPTSRRDTAADIFHLRSLLFAPGSDEHRLRKALESAADGIVADLEDAVAPDEKAAARDVVRDVLGTRARPVTAVRVNGADTRYFRDDLALVSELALDALVVPKATPDAVAALGSGGPPVIAIVETAEGLRLAYETARSARVAALLLGAADLGAELGLEPRPDGLEILHARSQVVVDSAAAGIRAPLDVVYLDFRDEQGLEGQSRLARSLGFRGKACIHPDQVEVVNRVFAPTAAEVDWAQRVIEAFEEGEVAGRGVVAFDGTMVDLPVVERARRILAEAKGASA